MRTDTRKKLLNNVGGDDLKNTGKDCFVENIVFKNSDLSVPDLVKIMPAPLFTNTAARKSPKSAPKPQMVENQQIIDSNNKYTTSKKSGFVFVGSNGEVLAESKGSSVSAGVVIKSVNKKENETDDWQKLRQISTMLEQSLGCHAPDEIQRYPC